MRALDPFSSAIATAAFCVLTTGTVAAQGTTADEAEPKLQTTCEAAGFKKYTSYKDMVAYLQEVQATTTEMKLGTYGETYEGRELPYAIFSRPTITQPWEALVSGKPIVLCHANVHGGERTLREGLLILVRELAKKGSEANKLLDHLVILVAPQINPDGFEATPRGTRGNSWGIDLNRDYMKLEQKSVINLVANMHNKWHPHIIIDGHNGGSRPYDLCYQSHSNASPAQSITGLCDKELFPFINKRMKDSGYRSFYYSGGNKTSWRVGGSDPRISRNYGGFINTIGLLFESPHGFRTLEKGARAGIVGYQAVLEFAAQNPDKVMNLINKARRETVAMGEKPQGEIAVQMKYGPEDFKVEYELRDGTKVKDGVIMKKPIVEKARKRAYAYLLPRDAEQAVALLRRHNITVEVLQKDTRIEVEAYKLEDVAYKREYNHAAAVVVKLGEAIQSTRLFRAGTYVVSTAQMQGRVVAHLLEPETNDNVVRWNTMDSLLPKTRVGAAAIAAANANANRQGRPRNAGDQRRRGGGAGARRGFRGIGRRRPQGPPVVPIYKLLKPTPLPTRILN